MSGVAAMVGELRPARAPPDRDRRPRWAGAQLSRKVVVKALAVLEEVGVAVLIAGAGDQSCPASCANAGAHRAERHAGDGVSVYQVVAAWHPALKTIELVKFVVDATSSVVSTLVAKSAASALLALKCPAEEDHVVPRPEQLRLELRRGPRAPPAATVPFGVIKASPALPSPRRARS
jgi:hypothetical protein